jgi:hypothetical protein
MEFGTAGGRSDSSRFFSYPAMRIASMPKWDDPKSGTVQDRARAYLAVNCSHCHNPEEARRTAACSCAGPTR